MAHLPSSAQQIGVDTCHKIYVDRDYSLGLEVRFQRNFPPLLEGLVSVYFKKWNLFFVQIEQEDWYYTVDTINKLFELAESVSLLVLRSCFWVVSNFYQKIRF